MTHTYQTRPEPRRGGRYAACSCGWTARWATCVDVDRRYAWAAHAGASR